MQGCPFYSRAHTLHRQHVELVHQCEHCALYCVNLRHHSCPLPNQFGGHVDAQVNMDLSVFKELTRSHRGAMVVYVHEVNEEQRDVQLLFTKIEDTLHRLLSQVLESRPGVVLKIKITVLMENDTIERQNGEAVTNVTYFYSELHSISSESVIEDTVLMCASEIIEKVNLFVENGSGWNIKQIESMEVNWRNSSFPQCSCKWTFENAFWSKGSC